MTTPVMKNWINDAAEQVGLYAIFHNGPFLIEDARESTVAAVGEPYDRREWGHVAKLAERKRLIRRIGYAATRSSRGSPKVLWAAA